MKKLKIDYFPNSWKHSKLLGILKLMLFFLFICFMRVSATDYDYVNQNESQQERTVSGKVTDVTDEALPGVTVMLQGTTIGTVTDIDGNYSLTNIPEDAILEFTFVGMQTQQVVVGDQTTINVSLQEDLIGIEEVVTVGYGTQRRVNLTGSVTRIDSEEMRAIPTPTIEQSIMGRSPGVFVKNRSGQPGDESAVIFNIRGFGEPLIIIDGMPSSSREFSRLNPSDIESFSVLKDASAASIYGARAGNGVVLVTTKRGETGFNVTYSGNIGTQFVTQRPEFVSSGQMARMENLGRQNMGMVPKWTDEQIQLFEAGTDPQYPNTDWWSTSFRDYAPQLQQNLSIEGGTDRVRYRVSGNHYYQEAHLIANETELDRYNIRSNLDIDLTDKLSLGLDLNASRQTYSAPVTQMQRGYTGGWVGVMIWAFRSAAYKPVEWPDETKLVARSPLDLQYKENAGYIDEKQTSYDSRISITYDLPFGFETSANFRFKESNDRYKDVWRKVPHWDYDWESDTYAINNYTNPYSRVYERTDNRSNFDTQFFLNWDGQFNDHNFEAIAVYEYLSDDYNWFFGERRNYEFDIDYLFAGPELDQRNSGSAGYGGRIGIVSRINYNYAGKYLLELSSRYDGSPLFPENTRWGFFPSASIGWRISQEDFIRDNIDFIDNLAIRLSHGVLGYDAISQFQYLQTYSMSGNYISDSRDNVLTPGIRSDGIANPSITWETMRTSNAAIDFVLFNSRMEGAFEVFYRLRSDVLGSRILDLPDVVGARLPAVNYAEYDNRGFEMSLLHRNRSGDFTYAIGGNFSINRGKTLFVDQVAFASNEARRTGDRIDQWTDRTWGYMTDGIFTSQEEIDNWADIDGKNNASIYPGDLRIVDYNGDGRITSADRVIIGGGRQPRMNYGINLEGSWKNFSVSMLWQGAGMYNISEMRSRDLAQPFFANNTPHKAMWDDAYIPENPWIPTNIDANAKFPIYGDQHFGTSRPMYQTVNQHWMARGDYLRLKNLVISYSLPGDLIQRIGLKNARVYVSGYNLLTFADYDYMDPEIDQRSFVGAYYPPTGFYNLGAEITF